MNLLPQAMSGHKAKQQPGPEAVASWRSKAVSLLLRFGVLFALWVVLSGFFDLFHLLLGAGCSAFVTFISADLFPPEVRAFSRMRTLLRLLAYLPWLLWQIVKSNVWVFYLVVHPRMNAMLDPVIVSFRSRLRSKLALTLLANSITLTPGTISVAVDERGFFVVHAIDAKSATGLPGEMEDKIARIFGEGA